MKKILLTVLISSVFILTSCRKAQETTLMFINSSDTSLSYKLLDDNISKGTIEYSHLLKKDLDNGYIYHTRDYSENYYFLNLEGYDHPVMSYYSFSNINNESGRLFGIKSGSTTSIEKNNTLGVRSASLVSYLFEQGFNINYEKKYIKNSYYSINDKYINWHYFIKDNIFINIAFELTNTLNLAAFEIGINNDLVINELVKNNEGYNVEFIDDTLLYGGNEYGRIQANNIIHLKLNKNNFEGLPKLYVNNEYIIDFSITKDKLFYYETYFFMPDSDIIIDIR